MSTPRPRSTPSSGFSLLEIVVAISIIAILVGVVGFRSGSAVQRGQASSLVQLVKTLEKASLTHYSDTGRYPREYAVHRGAQHRHLSGSPTFNGWSGPYIERPLARDDSNPFGDINLYDTLTPGNWISGYDLDGDGTVETTGNGCTLYLHNVPEEVAEQLDSTLDGGIPGDWFTTGRVVWLENTNRVLVYIFK